MRTNRHPELAFTAIAIEGGLLPADWLARAAQLKAPAQDPADYGILKGLEIRDEIGRYWRIAKAMWQSFENGRKAKGDASALTQQFVIGLLQEAFGFSDLEIRPRPSATSPFLAMDYAVIPVEMQGHLWPLTAINTTSQIPVVIAPVGAGLDKAYKSFGEDQRKRSAFGLVQEFLNRSQDALWGLCSDGLTLRIVRDNASLTRPAWVEIDLDTMFRGELYPDFAAVWLILHRSRFGQPDKPAEQCPLELWRTSSREEGIRARDRLRSGFEAALKILGQGFFAHPENHALRTALQTGALSTNDYFGELLRLVYRLIFLLTIEERDLLHPKGTAREVRDRYHDGYGLQRMRERAARRVAHDRFSDQWEALKITFRGLTHGEEALGLPALAGLFAAHQCPTLDASQLGNRELLQALFQLCWLREDTGISRVNWRDMGPDELGYVYEGLLELVPVLAEDGRTFSFANDEESRGNARKTSGSYYTPDSLVGLLLESALDPVIASTIAANAGSPKRTADALLSLTIVDPACGSGHFLLAAARRLAEAIARVKADGTPTPEEYRSALRDVVGRCIFGVDLNPLAVELCKVALWMEAIDPGLPLTFLDAHVRHGNALLGTSREVMGDGIPDEAWETLEDDVKKTTTSLRKKNRSENSGQELLLFTPALPIDELQRDAEAIEAASDRSVQDLQRKEQRWSEYQASARVRHLTFVYDAWCAAFMWPKPASGPLVEEAPTTAIWRAIRDGSVPEDGVLRTTVDAIAEEYRFFHWELAFPTVFAKGGFDVVLGNPPWERIKLQEQEFFASRDTAIANAKNAAQRTRLIKKLPETEEGQRLYDAFLAARRNAAGQSHFLRKSGVFPLTGTGDINTYQVFAERNRTLTSPHGRMGIILPTGIATDATTQAFFRDLVQKSAIVSLFDFENRKPLFVGVDSRFKFCLLTLVGSSDKATAAKFAFFLREPEDLSLPDKVFSLTPEEILLLNPNTGTCPVFRSRRDAEITLRIYRRVPVLINENDAKNGNPWGVKFMTMFHMSNDSHLFHTREELEADGWVLNGNIFERSKQTNPPPSNITSDCHSFERMLPLYEAKMMHHYDTRWATYDDDGRTRDVTPDEKRAGFAPLPRYWVHEDEVDRKLDGKWDKNWFLGWRNITNSTNARTIIATQLPKLAFGHSVLLALSQIGRQDLQACWSSFCVDFIARQKLGGTNLTFGVVEQLAVPSPDTFSPWRQWLAERVDRLNAQRLSDDENAVLRAELDAAAFHIYGVPRDDVDYILDCFPIIRLEDEAKYGEFRTKRLILEKFDELSHR